MSLRDCLSRRRQAKFENFKNCLSSYFCQTLIFIERTHNCVDEITSMLFGILILEGAHGWTRAFYRLGVLNIDHR